MIEVVDVDSDQWQLWRTLRLQALAEAPDAFGSTLAQWTGTGDNEQRWRDRLQNVALNLAFVADAQPVGMVSATIRPDLDSVELTSLWVSPHARGLGVGDLAVSRVLTWTRAHHPGVGVVLSAKTTNVAAATLYTRHGFTEVGLAPDSPDERLMVRL